MLMITQVPAPATLPPGQRIYAIGDIHGCCDQLEAMHALIAEDMARRPADSVTLIHMGDYIDRGPDSAEVIDLLLRPWPAGPAPEVLNMLGNHEEMLLNVIATDDNAAAAAWLHYGGSDTLASWSVPPRTRPRDWPLTIPPEHMDFLYGLTTLHRAGGYVFAHAGLRPGVPLERQSRHDLLWIREPFLSHEGPLPGVVVHGHTRSEEPVVRPNRIGIDTGAYTGGALTCLVLEADRMAFLAT
jgi:serine/threonine protein phosphatase 1